MFYIHDSVSATCNILEVWFACGNFFVNPIKPHLWFKFQCLERTLYIY